MVEIIIKVKPVNKNMNDDLHDDELDMFLDRLNGNVCCDENNDNMANKIKEKINLMVDFTI